jgi:TPP-dependent pyruvate/acetoin dehydrogenase alpha subunit
VFRLRLADEGILDAVTEKQMTEALQSEIDGAFEYARSAPLPLPSQASEFVYA